MVAEPSRKEPPGEPTKMVGRPDLPVIDFVEVYDGAPSAAGARLSLHAIRERIRREDAIVEALASAVEAKDRATAGHSARVARLACRIARALDPRLSRSRSLRYGFTLHDVGKIGVPEEILFKSSALESPEWDVMRAHPTIGSRIISPVGLGREAQEIVLHHHERWDGGGYPDGLEGEEIPIGARLFAVADAYDAMTSDRPYRKAIPAALAVDEISRESGRQFDPKAVNAFLSVARSADE
jgi:HD-GYP domain-containing protein (c-di-GMP phosphodiesterase class II)